MKFIKNQKNSLKILAVSQFYYPDTVSASQHLTDLLEALSKRGHEVTVYTSIRDYENPQKTFSKNQIINNVKIERINNTGFGKKNKISRLSDFITFNFLIFIKLLLVNKNKFDLIIGLTAPPLLSYIALKIARFKKIRFIYWTMDLQPELAIVANYVKAGSMTATSLQKRGDYIFKFSDKIITLDTFMEKHILKRTKGLNNKIDIIPPWPVINKLYSGERLNNPFRLENNFNDKIVIMYSGNHSVMHPLTTLLESAVILRDDTRFLFVHVGGGVGLKEVLEYKEKYNLQNVVTLPFQPRENIHISLGSADIQVVSLGESCIGYTHPNKIYGSMFIGKPILYIGPENSHISKILEKCEGNISIKHGDFDSLVEKLDRFARSSIEKNQLIGENNKSFANKYLHPTILINKMADSIENVV
tara:strand:- start:687 stop:1937 length:1251 start_codon:yes stop_codon:yes gene_type:complete